MRSCLKGLGVFVLCFLLGILYAGLVGLIARSRAGPSHRLAHLDRLVLARVPQIRSAPLHRLHCNAPGHFAFIRGRPLGERIPV